MGRCVDPSDRLNVAQMLGYGADIVGPNSGDETAVSGTLEAVNTLQWL